MTADDELNARLRQLPRVDAVIDALQNDGPRPAIVGVARRAIDAARSQVRSGREVPDLDAVVELARGFLSEEARHRLHPVINATGVLVHTNLGRVPLGRAQLDAVAEAASGYTNLEYDLDAGGRGTRYDHLSASIATATGAEAALVVNNNAAAVLLMLGGLCAGREVIISRGELIEIGGEFRIPDVMTFAGAKLVEVGTTNRTHLSDYEKAITPDTAAILKVHPSNYRVVGFTAEVTGRDLARLARGRGLLFLHDLGSGLIDSPDLEWTQDEPRVDDAVLDGADVVSFSGDKLLGGPQAGVIAGRAELIARLQRHPLLRALRVDKMTIAALAATFDAHIAGKSEDLPLWAMAAVDAASLKARAERIAAALDREFSTVKAEATPTDSVAGGGSLPTAEFGSWAVSVVDSVRTPDELARSLRHQTMPVIARVEDERLVLDLRAVPAQQDEQLLASLWEVFSGDA